jgi:hypothetical protein
MGLFGPSKERWVEVAAFPRYPGVSPCVVTGDGTGLIGTTVDSGEDDIVARLEGRRTTIHRVTSAGLLDVYEGPGGIVAFDGVDDVRVAIRGTLKEAGEGSDYHLLVSADGGWTFMERGPIEVLSIQDVLVASADEITVHGARTLARTRDGGDSWEALAPREEWDIVRERLRRDGHETEWSSKVPDDRLLLRVTIEGNVVRILTRAIDPDGGTGIQVFRSENGGRSFRRQEFSLSPVVDIAGAEYGMGVDLMGRIHGRLAVEQDPCACFDGEARYTLFEMRDLGLDDWNGEVSIKVCRNCGRHWLHVYYVNEAFSKSGRWCRGPIPAERAASITPDEARPCLEKLPRYLEGGSYFDGRTGWASGTIRL